MSSWLTTLTTPSCIQLGDMGVTLNRMKDRYTYWNDDYYQKAQKVVSEQLYQGEGATAFIEAVYTDINVLRPVYDGLGHASSACVNLQQVIETNSAKYDNQMASIMPLPQPSHAYWQLSISAFSNWRDQLIQRTLRDTGGGRGPVDTLGSVLENGNIYMHSGAYQAVGELVQQDAEAEILRLLAYLQSMSPPLDPSIAKMHNSSQPSAVMQPVSEQMKQEIQTYYHAAFYQLADEVEQNLTGWGAALCSAHEEFQATIQNSESYLSARDLFDLIYNHIGGGSQSTTKPITITPYKTRDGKNGLLITIGGTDINDAAWDTDLFTALQTGMGADNPYLNDVRQAIVDYVREHPEMTGSEITFAGYSLGGMTAQQMAQVIASGSDKELNGFKLHVEQIITYGAPVMGTPLNGVHYAMYDATYDPIPLLSSYENPRVGVNRLRDLPAGIREIIHTDAVPWDQKLHSYIDPRGEYGGQIHNINDVGNSVLGGNWSQPVMQNHLEYQNSDQLNATSTATGIDATTFGPSEHFSMQNTDNFVARLRSGQNSSQAQKQLDALADFYKKHPGDLYPSIPKEPSSPHQWFYPPYKSR